MILFSAAHSDRWSLTVDGKRVTHTKPYGWANGFEVPAAGQASLAFQPSPLRYGMLLLQMGAWVWVGRRLLRARVGPVAHGVTT